MISLSTPVKLTIPVISGDNRNEPFDVLINDKVVFHGKTFIEKGATAVDINITEVLRDHRYNGEHMISPMWVEDRYQLPNSTPTKIPYYIDTITVMISGKQQQRVDVLVLLQEFRLNPSKDPSLMRPLITDVVDVLPRYPKVAPNYNFMCGYFNNDTIIDINGYVYDNTPSENIYFSLPLNTIDNSLGGIYVNGELSALYDECPKDYYMCWSVGASVFSYGFDGLSESTRMYDRLNVEDVDNNTNRARTTITKGWRLNTGFIEKGYQDAFDWLFKSKWVGLYETSTASFYYVNVKDASLSWKTNRREMKNITVEVEERTKYFN